MATKRKRATKSGAYRKRCSCGRLMPTECSGEEDRRNHPAPTPKLAEATLKQEPNGGWAYTYSHGNGDGCSGGAISLDYALDGIRDAVRRATEKQAAVDAGRLCRFCGAGVTARNADCDFCESCYYSGRTRAEEPRIASILARVAKHPGVFEAGVQHTGGGCFGLGITLQPTGRLIFGTVALRNKDGEWETDAFLPTDPEDRWSVGVYTGEEGFYSNEGYEEDKTAIGLTDDEFVAHVVALAEGK